MNAGVGGGHKLHVVGPQPHQRPQAVSGSAALIGAGGGIGLHDGVLHGDGDLGVAVQDQLNVGAGGVGGFGAGLIAPGAQSGGKRAADGVVHAGGGAGGDGDEFLGTLLCGQQGNLSGRSPAFLTAGAVRGRIAGAAGSQCQEHTKRKKQSE